MSAGVRARRIIVYYGRLLILALLIIALLAFAGAWQSYANPPTSTVTEETDRLEVRTGLDTRAIVTGNTTLYDVGEELVNSPAYLLRATPTLTLTARTIAPTGQSVAVTQRLTVHMQATRDGQVFWEETELLAADEGRVTDEAALASSTTRNMSALTVFVAEKREEVGDVGSLSVQLRLRVDYETDEYRGRLTATAPLVLTGSAYWIDGDMTASREHSREHTRVIHERPDPLAYLGLSFLGSLALLGAIGIGVVLSRGVDLQQAEVELYRSRYQEWISEGEFPTSAEKRYVRIDSLEDLVDVAIDSNKRVIYDNEYDAYAVVDGDLVYYFATDRLRVDSWLDV